MHLSREKLFSLWNLEDMPACDTGMRLAEVFLVSCGEAIRRFGEEDPDNRITEITTSYMAMVDHGNVCDDCNEADVPEQMEVNERPEEDDLPPVDKTSADYKEGFQAGIELKPMDESRSAVWRRGWADAEE
jgi:hypothetical protein